MSNNVKNDYHNLQYCTQLLSIKDKLRLDPGEQELVKIKIFLAHSLC